MGLLRLLFALSVVFYHSSPLFGWRALSGPLAVHAFFVISGFYMSLILSEKYIGKNGSYKTFIINRFLRIYPLYLIILFATFFASLVKFFIGKPGPDNITENFILYFSHSTLPFFTLDLIHYIFRNLTLILTFDYFAPPSKIIDPLLLTQAWSLQVELIFYILAPFLARRSMKLFGVLVAVFAVVFYGYLAPGKLLPAESLTYLFLGHFIFFALGIFSYKLYKLVKVKKTSFNFLFSIYIFILLYTLVHEYIPVFFPVRVGISTDIGYVVVLALAVPFVFILNKKNKFDKIFGELSYPVFISHIFFVKVFKNTPFLHLGTTSSTLVLLFTVFIFSFLFVKYVERPIDAFRQSRLKKTK